MALEVMHRGFLLLPIFYKYRRQYKHEETERTSTRAFGILTDMSMLQSKRLKENTEDTSCPLQTGQLSHQDNIPLIL